jgi:hypothetical protein
MVCIFLAYRFGMSKLNSVLDQYTETQPVVLPVTKLPDAQMAELKKRIKGFQDSIQGHVNEGTLTLTGEELNALICDSDNPLFGRGHVYVTLESNEIKGQISVPADSILKLPMLKTQGRYINGSAAFKTSITNGQLYVYIDSLMVRNKPVDESFTTGLKVQNLADGFNRSTNSMVLSNYDSLVIKDDKLIIKSK